jgi:hypothetical protein
VDLRCPTRKHAVLLRPSADAGVVEVMCPSRFCGRRDGVTVLHEFSTSTGALIRTRLFRNPIGKKVN